MKIYKRVLRKVDVGPLRFVTIIGPEGTAARLRRGMKTVCRACNKALVEGDSLCAGGTANGDGVLILHEGCLDDQAREVIAKGER
jgi:hypothetical protein